MNKKRYQRTILATACIPWNESLKFDEKIFRKQIKELIKRGIKNIYVFGTAGEGYAVTDEQFETIVGVFAEEMKGPDLYPMAGLISLSFPCMLHRLQTAYNYGIRDFQFSMPSWGVLSNNELFSFIHQLCDPFPDCRFLHYNLMRTKRLLGINEYNRLANEIPNLIGVKFSTTDISTILDIANSNCPLQFFLTEMGFAYGSMIGEFGFLISIASSNIERAWEFFNASMEDNNEKLLKMQRELFLITKKLLEIVGSVRIDGAYDKIYSRILYGEFPLRLLPPYEGANDECFEEYCDFLAKEFPQWLES